MSNVEGLFKITIYILYFNKMEISTIGLSSLWNQVIMTEIALLTIHICIYIKQHFYGIYELFNYFLAQILPVLSVYIFG